MSALSATTDLSHFVLGRSRHLRRLDLLKSFGCQAEHVVKRGVSGDVLAPRWKDSGGEILCLRLLAPLEVVGVASCGGSRTDLQRSRRGHGGAIAPGSTALRQKVLPPAMLSGARHAYVVRRPSCSTLPGRGWRRPACRTTPSSAQARATRASFAHPVVISPVSPSITAVFPAVLEQRGWDGVNRMVGKSRGSLE